MHGKSLAAVPCDQDAVSVCPLLRTEGAFVRCSVAFDAVVVKSMLCLRVCSSGSKVGGAVRILADWDS